jgi:hypothetical protein
MANWPTPTRLDSTSMANRTAGRSDPDSKHHDGVTLTDAIRMWPTPHGFNGQDKDGGYGTGGEFEKFCKQWATPAARDYRSPNSTESQVRRKGNLTRSQQLANQVVHQFGPASRPDPTTATAGASSSPATPTSRLQLNPRFVAVLMGLPPGWISCAPSATPSCPSKPKPLSVCSGTAPLGAGRD